MIATVNFLGSTTVIRLAKDTDEPIKFFNEIENIIKEIHKAYKNPPDDMIDTEDGKIYYAIKEFEKAGFRVTYEFMFDVELNSEEWYGIKTKSDR